MISLKQTADKGDYKSYLNQFVGTVPTTSKGKKLININDFNFKDTITSKGELLTENTRRSQQNESREKLNIIKKVKSKSKLTDAYREAIHQSSTKYYSTSRIDYNNMVYSDNKRRNFDESSYTAINVQRENQKNILKHNKTCRGGLDDYLHQKFVKAKQEKKWFNNYKPNSNENSMLEENRINELFIESDKSMQINKQKAVIFSQATDLKSIMISKLPTCKVEFISNIYKNEVARFKEQLEVRKLK